VDDCDRPPDLAAGDAGRGVAFRVRVPEAVLELGERRMILRTEA
jgi:hypothetical protein